MEKKQMELKETALRESTNVTPALEPRISNKYKKEAADIEARLSKTKHELNALKSHLDQVERRNPNLRFEYKDPSRNFDRRQVIGVAAKLFRVQDEGFCTGLQSVAGGKIFNVVVENEQVGKALMDHGELQQRTTFIPLNRISGNRIDSRIVEEAKRVGGRDNVWSPLDLIEYEEYLEPAMCHLFGQSLLCRDLETANKVAYDKNINKTCYTLDGDMVSPGGEMSGGAPSRGNTILAELFILNQKGVELKQVLRDLQNQLISDAAEQYMALSEDFEYK